MGNRITIALVLLAAIISGYFVYRHRQEEKMDVGGEVTCQGCMTPEEKAKFEKEDRNETADGQSARKVQTATADDAAGSPNAGVPAPVAGQAGATPNPTPTPTPTAAAANSSMSAPPGPGAQTTAANPATAAGNTGSTNMPVVDTLAPNAPNGMAFGGKGTYQWYRQGNLTWRIDTVSGRSCIVYATMEEWRKQIVMSHGCGREA